MTQAQPRTNALPPSFAPVLAHSDAIGVDLRASSTLGRVGRKNSSVSVPSKPRCTPCGQNSRP